MRSACRHVKVWVVETSPLFDAHYLRFAFQRGETKILDSEDHVVGTLARVRAERGSLKMWQARDPSGAIAWIRVRRRTGRLQWDWHQIMERVRDVSNPDYRRGFGYISRRTLWLSDDTYIGSFTNTNPQGTRYAVLDGSGAPFARIERTQAALLPMVIGVEMWDLTYEVDELPSIAAQAVIAASVAVCRETYEGQ
jgi:hypothetical protein